MDLYIQIGILLLFLAALALFIFIYTGPAQQFTEGINQNNQKINDRLTTVEGMDVAPFNNNTASPGTSIYPLIRDAAAGKLAILVQTKNSQGLVVNYGYQLRSANTMTPKMKAWGFSGVGAGTDFEKNYVTTANELFLNKGAEGQNKFGIGTAMAGLGLDSDEAKKTLLGDGSYVPGAILNGGDNDNPNIFFADPTITSDDASKKGRTFASTGLMYTDQVIKSDMPVNNNFSYADNQGSLYRFDKNSTYYTALIVNSNSEIVGVYVEEHGVNPQSAALAHMMKANGTITNLY